MSTLELDIQALTVSERIQLAEDLWDSIATKSASSVELTRSQETELDARLEAHRNAPETAIAWDQVRAKLFSGVSGGY